MSLLQLPEETTVLMEETPKPGEGLKILIADDHEIIRVGTNAFLRSKLKCAACLEAANGRIAI